MADNTELDPGTGGDVIRDKDRTGVKTQIVALDLNPAGAEALMAGAMPVTDNGGSLTVDGTVAVSGTVAVTDNSGSLTVDNAALSVTGGGVEASALRVTLASDSTGVVSIDDNGGSLTVDGTVTANLGTAAVTNAGTFATQESGGALTSLQLLDDTIVADDAAFTVGTTKVTVAGFLADQASTDSVNEGDAGAARMTLDRKQIVTMAPSADTEGLSFVKDLDLDETETAIKATAGKLYGWYLYNDGAAEVYVKLYNATVATVVVGTTVPDLTLPVPAGAAANVEFTNGIAFGTAITAAATTGVADNDTGAPAANQVVANFFYQ